MTAGVVGVLAEALAQHQLARLLYDEGRCACGYWFDVADDPHSDRIKRMHREHVASVVAALPNIAIVPVVDGPTGFRVDAENFIVDSDSYDTVCHVDVAEKYAGLLIAAARGREQIARLEAEKRDLRGEEIGLRIQIERLAAARAAGGQG